MDTLIRFRLFWSAQTRLRFRRRDMSRRSPHRPMSKSTSSAQCAATASDAIAAAATVAHNIFAVKQQLHNFLKIYGGRPVFTTFYVAVPPKLPPSREPALGVHALACLDLSQISAIPFSDCPCSRPKGPTDISQPQSGWKTPHDTPASRTGRRIPCAHRGILKTPSG
jgi:hypothetical protein